MADETSNEAPNVSESADWAVWLAWGWVVMILLVTIAELADWENLRLALDFQRHFR